VDKQSLDQMWDHVRQTYGVYLRLLEAIPDDRYQTHPIPDMRTPAELVAHVSGVVIRDIAQGVAKGEITADESAEAGVAAGIASGADAVGFAKECWADAQRAVDRIGDAELQAMVPTPWGMTFPGWVGFQVLNEEFLHHRGQLSVYARACGVAPPFIWGFEENAPEFRPA